MTDSKFNALIKLLDDNDQEVANQVEGELFNLGTQGIGRLEQVWEKCEDVGLQDRLEDLIGRIQTVHFTDELLDWRRQGGEDLIAGWLIVNQFQYPTLNVQKYRNEISKLVNRIWLQMNGRMKDIERLCLINKFIYGTENFTGNYKNNERADNNYLSVLIDKKMGNSLSMSTFYSIICHQLELPVQVINFAGYYSLRYIQQDAHCYIDAYNKGMFFTLQQVQQFLKKLKVDENVYHYKPLSNIYIVLDLIQALAHSYKHQREERRAARFMKLLQDIEIKFD